jgi:phage gp46-like protein
MDFASTINPLAVGGIGNTLIDLYLDDTGDLAGTESLQEAVIVSLFTDRVAALDDQVDGDDPRGWWGDMPLNTANPPAVPDFIGSRLWLLRRAPATADTLNRAHVYIRESLQWMLDDGVAARVDVAAAWRPSVIGLLDIRVTINRTVAGGIVPPSIFDLEWSATMTGG